MIEEGKRKEDGEKRKGWGKKGYEKEKNIYKYMLRNTTGSHMDSQSWGFSISPESTMDIHYIAKPDFLTSLISHLMEHLIIFLNA